MISNKTDHVDNVVDWNVNLIPAGSVDVIVYESDVNVNGEMEKKANESDTIGHPWKDMVFFVDGPLKNDGDAEETFVPNNRNKKIIGQKLDSKFNWWLRDDFAGENKLFATTEDISDSVKKNCCNRPRSSQTEWNELTLFDCWI